MRTTRWAALFALTTTAATACGPNPSTISEPVARGNAAALSAVADAEALWAERLDRAKLLGAIDAWKRAVAIADDDAQSWLALARANYFLGDCYLDLEHADNDLVTRTFEEGAAYADRGLRALSPVYEQRRRGGADVDEAATGLGVEAVPYIYWWGLNAIRWADRKGWTAGLKVYKHVRNVMVQVEKLQPDYEHAGADRYLGAFYSQAPGVAGGDTEKGHKYLERAIQIAPTYLENHVVIAERYARSVHDDALFDAQLRYVRDTPSSVLPDAVPDQEMAKKKARGLAPRLFATQR